jgi:hypothetical protein
MEKKNYKCLFMDHDGVICLPEQFGRRRKFTSSDGWKSVFDGFDPKAVKVLNKILEATDAEIVISSDWRFHGDLELLQQVYLDCGVIKVPIGMTTKGPVRSPDDFPWFIVTELEQTRSLEILRYLRDHPEITKWVAVDDLDMSVRNGWGLTNFVLTPRSYEGIKQVGIKDKIIKFLNE